MVTNLNFPMVKEMSVTYELISIEANVTEVGMTSDNSSSPSLMKYLMSGTMNKFIVKHLFGMKFYIETDKKLNKTIYSNIV